MVYKVLVTTHLKFACQTLRKQQLEVERLREIFNTTPQENTEARKKAMFEYQGAKITLQTREQMFIDEVMKICDRGLSYEKKFNK